MCSIPQVTFETLLYVLEKQQVVEFLGEHLFYLHMDYSEYKRGTQWKSDNWQTDVP